MTDDLTITVKGGDEIVAKLQRFGVDMERALELICDAGAAVMQDAVAEKAPGSIGEAILRETKTKTAQRVTVVTGPSKSKFYALFLERGTKPHKIKAKDAQALALDNGLFRASANHPGIGARPFMRPAFDGTTDDAERAMGSEVKRVISRV